jgi:hypothetical protein
MMNLTHDEPELPTAGLASWSRKMTRRPAMDNSCTAVLTARALPLKVVRSLRPP